MYNPLFVSKGGFPRSHFLKADLWFSNLSHDPDLPEREWIGSGTGEKPEEEKGREFRTPTLCPERTGDSPKVLPKCLELRDPTPPLEEEGTERPEEKSYLRPVFEDRPNAFPRFEEKDLPPREECWNQPLDFPPEFEFLKFLLLEKPQGVEFEVSLDLGLVSWSIMNEWVREALKSSQRFPKKWVAVGFYSAKDDFKREAKGRSVTKRRDSWRERLNPTAETLTASERGVRIPDLKCEERDFFHSE